MTNHPNRSRQRKLAFDIALHAYEDADRQGRNIHNSEVDAIVDEGLAKFGLSRSSPTEHFHFMRLFHSGKTVRHARGYYRLATSSRNDGSEIRWAR
jgi:hypothetical protein